MLREHDLYKLRERAQWDEDTREWAVPLFMISQKQGDVAFPTIGAKARVEQAREEREIQIVDNAHGSLHSGQGNYRADYGL